MKTGKRRNYVILSVGLVALLLAACNVAQQKSSLNDASKLDASAAPTEARRVAENVLGQQAEIISHGDLARNGLEYMLVVNRFDKAPRGAKAPGNSVGIFITRAAMVEKDNGKWTEVLRCDERLKNRNGYLGGSPAEPVTGWRLELEPNGPQGLEMKFTPASEGESGNQTISVRWNSKTKRYQSLDQSHERYLAEAPMSETQFSIIK
jgi:hypothetical protein